jgi:hypothetical protein
MGYFIITAKHHDAFAMYDSKVSDATIVKATQGNAIEKSLGKITLKPGSREFRVESVKIAGEELMLLRKIILKLLTVATAP